MKHREIVQSITRQKGVEPKNKDLANIIGITADAIRSRAFRNKEYSYDEVKKIEKYFNISIEAGILESITDEILNKRLDYLEQKEDFPADYYPDLFGSCGTGVFVLSEQKEQMQVPKKIIEDYSSQKKYSVINAYGDSMQPFIHDRDLLVVEHYNGEQIKDNRVYVFRFGENIFVKRLVLNINQLIIKSDNTEYKPITLELNENTDIQIIGQIVGLMRSM